jgi:hypothetical protein
LADHKIIKVLLPYDFDEVKKAPSLILFFLRHCPVVPDLLEMAQSHAAMGVVYKEQECNQSELMAYIKIYTSQQPVNKLPIIFSSLG